MKDAFRIGQGYDIHRFLKDEGTHAIALGGIHLAHTHALDAHSDGDVLLHALCDALLGALALGDIGDYFPPSDPKWHKAHSEVFVRFARDRVHEHGFHVINVDLTLLAELPKINAHRQTIRENIASMLGIPVTRVSLKATTSEQIGSIGRKEGIAALAVVLLGS